MGRDLRVVRGARKEPGNPAEPTHETQHDYSHMPRWQTPAFRFNVSARNLVPARKQYDLFILGTNSAGQLLQALRHLPMFITPAHQLSTSAIVLYMAPAILRTPFPQWRNVIGTCAAHMLVILCRYHLQRLRHVVSVTLSNWHVTHG